MTNDIICEVLKCARGLKNDDAFYGFMWRIAENTFKKRIRKSNFQTIEFDESFVGTYWATPEEEYLKTEELHLLRRELSLLSKQYRETTVAYYITGKSCSEISTDFGISTEMVKYYIECEEEGSESIMYNLQLETFLCVAECGSFNRAAEKLHISPPAVIKQINLLEDSLDLQLFVRTHRGLQLTEAGKSLAQDTKYIIQYCKDSITRAKNAMQRDEEIIRIGTSPMAPAQVLVDLWPKLQEACPNTKFQLVPFDNTPENAREILANLGQNIDVVAGIFDETMLNLRQCKGLEISREAICCAVSIHHKLAQKDELTIQDLYGEKLMLMKREWSRYVDLLRDDLWKNHPQIQIVDFDFYDVGVFNQCENNNCVLMAVQKWQYVHPLLKILPVDWKYTIPYGLLHAPEPSPVVRKFLQAVDKITKS